LSGFNPEEGDVDASRKKEQKIRVVAMVVEKEVKSKGGGHPEETVMYLGARLRDAKRLEKCVWGGLFP